MVSEASYTLSGYGIYSQQILSRLHKSGKYHVAEFASYAAVEDPRDKQPWRVYPNGLSAQGGNDPRIKQLNSAQVNQFGAWRFEQVLLDFKPDIVFDIRDPWMFTYQNLSPLRRFFNWAVMPTVDSMPQQDEWMQHFADADGVFTYSDWGLDILKNQGGGKIKLISSAPPAINLNEFKPILNTAEHKRKFFGRDDINVIGTVMRNQRRKLYPDLLVAFSKFLELCKENGRDDLAAKTYLYFHTSYPEVAGCWNIPRLLKETGLASKVFFTYICKNCGHVFASNFQDARTVCTRCQHAAAVLPSVSYGLSTPQLNDVYNLFDAYVQYAVCEGFGMPQVEAAGAGVPVFSTDYSAMTDVVRKLNGTPIKVARMFRSPEEDAWKALPDNDDCADKLFKFFSQSVSARKRKGMEARKAVEQHYTWDKTYKLWESYFDTVELTGLQGKWDAPPQFLRPNANPQDAPTDVPNEDYVDWCLANLYGSSEHVNTLMSMDMVRALNYELAVQTGAAPVAYSRQHVVDKIQSMVVNHNQCEEVRCGFAQVPPQDWIEYANRRPV